MYSARLVTATKLRSRAASVTSFSSTVAVASESRSHEQKRPPQKITPARQRTALAADEAGRNASDGSGADFGEHLGGQRPGLTAQLGCRFGEPAARLRSARAASGILPEARGEHDAQVGVALVTSEP